MESTFLPLIYAILIAFAVIMYVILDGFDLGIGILFPWIQDPHDRNLMVNSVAPVWDGNETWMVFGAALLYGGFPIAYSTLLPQLYIPILIMLAALIFRGVAFEFRFKAGPLSKGFWDTAFSLGSIVAAIFQGIILGTFVQGFGTQPLTPGVASQNWLTPFSLMAGLGVAVGYALLGSTWLIVKTSGHLQSSMYFLAKRLLITILVFALGVSIWSPLTSDFIFERWFSLPNFFWLMPLPILTFLFAIYAFYGLQKRYENQPFLCAIGIFLLCYGGFCISSWPYIVPRSLTIWQAASNKDSMEFLLVGALILLPLLLAYTAYAYYVFRGKVELHEGYHE